MNLLSAIQSAFVTYLQKNHLLDEGTSATAQFVLNVDPSKQQFGDLTSNAAMIIAKKTGKAPRVVAQEIIDGFNHEGISHIEIAGPGFLNAYLKPSSIQEIAHELFVQKELYFKPEQPHHVAANIEFVSANPTGPLHLGHGRGGIIGDVLGNVMRFSGQRATKEFYINDAGNQIARLGESFKIRCQQLAGMDIAVPEDGYRGDYLVDLAKHCYGEYGTLVLEKPDIFFADYAKKHLLQQQQETLAKYGIIFDEWFSEKQLHDSGAVAQAIANLQERGFIYENEGALWFASTRYGDDKDRVVRKKTGEWTYVAADIAYLRNKIDRGYKQLIMILGHDHHSYVVRLQGILKALDYPDVTLDVILYQLVTMKASGQLVQMSKRAGTMVTLHDVIDTVGTDVARFFYLNRKADAQLEFDLDLALKKTEENPVYYLQYAYVRTNSVRAKAKLEGFDSITADDRKGLGGDEALLIKKIASLKSVIASVNSNYQTHLLTYYLLELADIFHRYYAHHRIIVTDNKEQTRARLFLVELVNHCFETVLELLEISRPEKM
ncbi:arginine--tRNA ligase [Candidatus Dependentiae bacterium Noda2021]|nr:arginine--tRNA ligase [Candidatus Dependentiae bacterium Noda2021]